MCLQTHAHTRIQFEWTSCSEAIYGVLGYSLVIFKQIQQFFQKHTYSQYNKVLIIAVHLLIECRFPFNKYVLFLFYLWSENRLYKR